MVVIYACKETSQCRARSGCRPPSRISHSCQRMFTLCSGGNEINTLPEHSTGGLSGPKGYDILQT